MEEYFIMAIKVKDSSKTLGSKFDTYVKSQYKFLSLVHAGAINGLLTVTKPTDSKHKHNFKHQPVLVDSGDLGYEQYYHLDMTDNVVIPHVTMVYSNGANTAGRVVYIDNTRIAHSPLRELNEASKRTQTMVKVLDTAKQLQEIRSGSSEFYSYMTTLTIPNCDKDELNQVVGSMSTRITAVIKALQDGYRNGNGLRLVDHSGRPVQILGAIVKIEITINQAKLKSCDSQGIFHPHIHIVLITANELALGPSRRILFHYWRNKNSDMVLSRKAFNFKKAYSKNQMDSDDTTSIVAEATKYATKPTMYKLLPTIKDSNNLTDDDQFKLEIFCEVFKTIKGRQLSRSYGLIRDSTGFVNFLKNGIMVKYTGNNPMHGKHERISIFDAFMFGNYYNNKQIHVPDIMTTRNELIPGGNFNQVSLSDDELLYANKGLLSGATWELPDNIKWPSNNQKADEYKELLTRFGFVQPGLGNIIDQLQSWIQTIDQRKDKVLHTVLDASERSFQYNDLLHKREDVRRLVGILEDVCDQYGADTTTLTTHDYSQIYRDVDLMQVMDAHHATLHYDSYGKPNDVTFDEPDVERRLVSAYKKHDDVRFISATSFLPREILIEYGAWLKHTPSEFIDNLASYTSHAPELEIDTVSKMDAKTAQKWINKAFNVSTSNGPQIDFHTMFTNAKMSQVQTDNDADLEHLFDDGVGDDNDDDSTEINALSDVFPDLNW